METKKVILMQILSLLEQVLSKVGVHQTKTGHDVGLTNLFVNTIRIINENKGCTMRTLAKELMVVPPAATRIVNDLIKKDMIQREADSTDRRLIHLYLKPKTMEIFTQIHIEAAEILNNVLNKMTDNEQDALIVGLGAFVQAILEVDKENQSD
jgi:DNA-binding MarR family transcriptional regulator